MTFFIWCYRILTSSLNFWFSVFNPFNCLIMACLRSSSSFKALSCTLSSVIFRSLSRFHASRSCLSSFLSRLISFWWLFCNLLTYICNPSIMRCDLARDSSTFSSTLANQDLNLLSSSWVAKLTSASASFSISCIRASLFSISLHLNCLIFRWQFYKPK